MAHTCLECGLSDEEIKKILLEVADRYYDAEIHINVSHTAIAKGQVTKLINIGWKSPEEVQEQVAEAVRKERERKINILDDYYDMFFGEFCEKYNITDQNSDAWDARKVIRQVLSGEVQEK